jgi:hypothetical protein
MRKSLRSTALAATTATIALAATPHQAWAQSYPIDCAILLCLSGGWPASVPCARARAEFIRRITPWPVEPPLQIWRCPMGASFEVDPDAMSTTRIWDALLADMEIPLQSYPSAPLPDDGLALAAQPAVLRHESGGAAMPLPEGFSLQLAQDYINEEGRADIDISDPAFNFVRSIRVYDINWWEYDHENDKGDHTCRRWGQKVRLGIYGTQGDFAWRNAHVTQATNQPWLGFSTRQDESCAYAGRFRGVAVEWRDYEGNHGYEVVRY